MMAYIVDVSSRICRETNQQRVGSSEASESCSISIISHISDGFMLNTQISQEKSDKCIQMNTERQRERRKDQKCISYGQD
jgi:hypothetical protein